MKGTQDELDIQITGCIWTQNSNVLVISWLHWKASGVNFKEHLNKENERTTYFTKP